ncbi:MAG: hypothetical protein VR64_03590 [Desulfatitalea sp. BRH_c12]|nr:MAG: hypothetical protein VR64_03590 [Desulfatitalea sp. BRH_c12]
MRRTIGLLGLILLTGFFINACAKPLYERGEQRSAYWEAPNKNGRYQKKTAIAIQTNSPGPYIREGEELLTQTMVQTIRDKGKRLLLLTAQDPGFPAALQNPDSLSTSQGAFMALQAARLQGYHCLLQAKLIGIQPDERKTGLWWFRKNRFFMTVVVALDVYDTFLGAKAASYVRQQTVQVDEGHYRAFVDGTPQAMAAVDEMIVDLSEDLGEQAAEAVEAIKWIASVADIQGQNVYLGGVQETGLRVGDRLSIYEGRRVMEGSNGEKFIVPGYKVSDILIQSLNGDTAEAVMDEAADIQPGDIAVPAG